MGQLNHDIPDDLHKRLTIRAELEDQKVGVALEEALDRGLPEYEERWNDGE